MPLLQQSMNYLNYLNNLNFLVFVKENSYFIHSGVLTFPYLLKCCPTKFKPLSDKLEKRSCISSVCIFLLKQMNCEIIADSKLGK